MTVKIQEAREADFSPLEYVIGLGAQGDHILFDRDRIREAFSREERAQFHLGSDLMRQVREAINQVFSIPDFEGKRQYIADQPLEVQDVLIHLYFQMVEKSLLLSQKQFH